MISQRTTEANKTDSLITLRDSLLAHKARGEDLDDVINGLSHAIKIRIARKP